MILLWLNFHRRIKIMRVGVKASMYLPLSAEQWESTMLPQWKIYPSILQILVNHPPLQISMPNLHITDMGVVASPTTNWCSPAWMTRTLTDPANITANTPVPMTVVTTLGSRHIIFSTPQPVSPHEPISHRWLGHHYHLLQRRLPNSAIGWWCMVWKAHPR